MRERTFIPGDADSVGYPLDCRKEDPKRTRRWVWDLIETSVKIEMPVEHGESGHNGDSKGMTMGKGGAELVCKHPNGELIYTADYCPVSKELDFPCLQVDEETQCDGRNKYRNGQQPRPSEQPEKQGENYVVVKLHRN